MMIDEARKETEIMYAASPFVTYTQPRPVYAQVGLCRKALYTVEAIDREDGHVELSTYAVDNLSDLFTVSEDLERNGMEWRGYRVATPNEAAEFTRGLQSFNVECAEF